MSDPCPLKLKSKNVEPRSQLLEVTAEGLTFGRDPSNDIVLDGTQFPFISTFHARVSCEGGELLVEDLESKNGTLVNGRLIEEPTKVAAGDLVQFGRESGASYAVVSSSASATQTVTLGPADLVVPADGKPPIDFGNTTILRLRERLGLPERGAEDDGKPRGPAPLTFVMLAIIAMGIGVPIYYFVEVQRSVNADLEESLSRANEQLRSQQERYDAQLAQYQQRERELTGRAEQLKRRIQQVETSGQGNLDALRTELEDTQRKLEQYDPMEIERVEQERLRGVLSSIVYIEKRIVFRDVETGRYLHETEVDGSRLRDLDPSDLVVAAVDSGSGFCVSPDGVIVSNAHVVEVEDNDEIDYRGSVIVRAPVIDIVFSGTSTRYPAEIVKTAYTGSDDFAILKIQPFEGMPHIEGFSVEQPIPTEGSSVRLFGFPLGKKLIQDRNDVMKASVFTGSVSRQVDAYLQVQSAVYPGNSGGPVVDAEGHVIGVVTAVFTVDGGQIASDLGFFLPISRLRKIWPPPRSP